uniref:Neur_chan_LBD domain-containing protein n=1 Tax=Heterorhabditis bacteriophora TaxID=37862 RepID=A0A1I7XFA1_HETBA
MPTIRHENNKDDGHIHYNYISDFIFAFRRKPVRNVLISDVGTDVSITIVSDRSLAPWEDIFLTAKLPHEDVFNFLWPFAAHTFTINATKNEMRDMVKGIPTWWFDGVIVVR